uniref:Si:dkey-238d18.12 n=1 Tax=Echeneis naucrates TaxID=173247 RepID=A0A665SZK2_ECHNA
MVKPPGEVPEGVATNITCSVSYTSILAANVPFRITGLTHSCVVIPCSFCYERPLTRGIWSKESGDVIYHNSQSNVLDHFKGRTRLLGDLMEGNCSLEIDNIMPFDNGPFCFHAEKGHEKYIFNNSCVFIIMKATPGKPVMSPLPKDVSAGSVITVSCSVTHTCPSHPPEFSWSIPILSSEVTHIMRTQDIWEITSTITFMVAGGDGVKNLTCTAIFWRDKSSLPISIPVSALVLIAVILAAVLGVIVCRKRSS